MEIAEVAVWSAMLGGLLAIAAAAATDAGYSRSIGAVRNLVFILLSASACVLITGLPEAVFPGLPTSLLMFLKVSLGPLAGSLALALLGLWLGGVREDVVVYRLTAWGGLVLALATLVLAVLGALVTEPDFARLLWVAAWVTMAAVVLALIATVRAAMLGDALARWMALACVLLALTVGGLYLRGLSVPGFGLGTWIVTAISTVGFYIIASALILIRNRLNHRLARLARLQTGLDPATDLPTGAMLLSEVEHAFWRTARTRSQCTVVCLHLRNLYELAQAAGYGVEQQIQVVVAARIRRAAGFRCIVGLYHPRCFVVVISADQQRSYVHATIERLQQLVAEPLAVIGADQTQHDFMPQLGVGVVSVDPALAKPVETINEAERIALGTAPTTAGHASSSPAPVSQDHIATGW